MRLLLAESLIYLTLANVDIREQLIKHEGLRLKPYKDSLGIYTIGVGRNLDDVGISEDEALYLLDNDIANVEEQCSHFAWFSDLSLIRKQVIIDMVFNLGLTRFLKFKKTISYLSIGDFKSAAKEMLDSKWKEQVGIRAITLSLMLEHDVENTKG